jgi:hypothetical protein
MVLPWFCQLVATSGTSNEKAYVRNQYSFNTKRERVCRVSGGGRLVASPASMCGMRAHRLLRQLSEPACGEALQRSWTPHRREL